MADFGVQPASAGVTQTIPDGSISLDQKDTDGTVSLFPQGTAPTYSPEYTAKKANQYWLALGSDNQINQDQLYQGIEDGNTQNFDAILQRHEELRQQQVRQNFLMDWAKQRDPNALPTPEERTVVDSLTNDEMHAPELGTILSRRYADLLTNTAMTAPGNVVFQRANQNDPYRTLDVANKTADWVQRSVLAQDAYELYQKRYQGEGWLTKATGFGLTMIPGYQYLLTQNQGIEGDQTGLTTLSGSAMDQRINYLYSLPPTQMKEQLTSYLEDLYNANPQEAVRFAQAMMSFSRGAYMLGNLTDVADLTTLGGGLAKGVVKKGVEGLAGKAARAAEGPIDVEFSQAPNLLTGPGAAPAQAPGSLPGRPQLALPGQGPRQITDASRVSPEAAPGQGITGAGTQMNPNPVNEFGQPVWPGDARPNFEIVPSQPPKGLTGAGEQMRRTTLDEYGRPVQPRDYQPNFVTTTASQGPLKTDYTPNFTMVEEGDHQTVSELANVGRKIVSVSNLDPTDLPRVAGEMGDHATAAKIEFLKNVPAGDATGLSKLTQQNIEQHLPTGMAPSRAFSEVEDLSSASRRRMPQTVLDAENSRIIQDLLRVDRLEPTQLLAAANQTFALIQKTFRNLAHHIIDSDVIPAEKDPLTNLNKMKIWMGGRDGTLFPSPEAAKNWANRYLSNKTRDFEVEQVGAGGWAVTHTRPIAENGMFRDAEIETGLKTPDTVFNRSFLGKVRMADSQLPESQVRQRGRVVHGGEWMGHQLAELTQNIAKLSADEKQAVQNVLQENMVNREWYQNKGDFFKNYLQRNGVIPNDREWKAYQEVVQLSDTGAAVRNASIISQMARKGGRFFEFGKGEGYTSFNGVKVDNLPWQLAKEKNGGFTVQVVNDSGSVEKTLSSKFLTSGAGESSRKAIQERIDQGYQILLEPEKAKYYVIKNFRDSNIEGDLLGYNPGGHQIAEYEHWIKVPQLEKSADGLTTRYTGDVALWNAPTRAHAVEAAKLLEQGRQLVLKNDPSAAVFFRDHLQGVITLNEFKQQLAKGVIPRSAPILATRAGERTAQIGKWSTGIENFEDSVSSPHNVFSDVRGRFTGEQADRPLDVIRVENNALNTTDLSPFLNPWDALKRGLQDIIDLSLGQDLRIKAAEDYAQEFGHLHQEGPAMVAANPISHMANPNFAPGAPKEQIAAAKRFANKTLQLTNHKTSDELDQASVIGQITDFATERWGLEGKRAAQQNLGLIRDPGRFIRSAVFHPVFGFFNPVQYFVQASEILKAMAISPKAALQSMPSMLAMRWALETGHLPNVAGLGKAFEHSLLMPKEDWLKMVDEFKRSGYSIVGHDHQYSDVLSPEISKAPLWKDILLKKGSIFFREGELTARMAAWQTAWREMRQQIGNREMTRQELTQVMQRAKNLNTNMGRDSRSDLDANSIGSLTTAWLPYHTRQAEQMYSGLLGNGRKFTQAEKIRLMVGMSAVYGIRAPLALGGIPAASMLGYYLSADGNTPETGTGKDVLINGLLPGIVKSLGGGDYDFSRYGPGGVQPMWDYFNGDKSLLEIIAGASAGKAGQIIQRTAGSIGDMVADIRDGFNKKGTVEKFLRDAANPLREIASVDAAQRTWEIVNTAQWITKNGLLVKTDSNLKEALANALFGLTPKDIANAFNANKQMQNQKAWQAEALKKVRQYGAEINRYNDQGDFETANQYRNQAYDICRANQISWDDCVKALMQGWTDRPFTQRTQDNLDRYYQKRQQGVPNLGD